MALRYVRAPSVVAALNAATFPSTSTTEVSPWSKAGCRQTLVSQSS